jgi:ferrous-iron efflux pump FieF
MDNHGHHSSVHDPKQRESQKLMKLSTYITVAGVSLIILAKVYGWFATESVTILASLVDSLLDICVSIMNLLALHYALQPADNQHRFGHGKVEDIAVFSQAVFFIISGLGLILTSINRFFFPNDQILNSGETGIEILVFSTIITLIIVVFQRYVMNKSRSHIIEADSIHYITDFLTNLAAIIGILVATHYQMPMFDSITAIVISIYIETL